MVKPEMTNIGWPGNLSTLVTKEYRMMSSSILPQLASLLAMEKILPQQLGQNQVESLYIPFAQWLADQHNNHPLIIGINGAQGAGKTTFCKVMNLLLEQLFNKNTVCLSIDDLYKSRQQRQILADQIHPLLITRGVPGTHNTELGIKLLKQLRNQDITDCLIPVFDKATDNPLPQSRWKAVKTHYDIILFEGWCVGSRAQTAEQLKHPINQLEREEDSQGIWRNHINQQLQSSYTELFSMIDIMVMLKIPDFNKVYEWRKLQEHKLRQSLNGKAGHTMSDSDIKRFVMHFERITRHNLKDMPKHSDIIFHLNDNHQIHSVDTQLSNER